MWLRPSFVPGTFRTTRRTLLAIRCFVGPLDSRAHEVGGWPFIARWPMGSAHVEIYRLTARYSHYSC